MERIYISLFFVGILLGAIDVIGNPEKIKNLFGFSSGEVLFSVFLSFLIFRFFGLRFVTKKFFLKWLLPFGIILAFSSIVLAFTNYLYFPNYIYSKTLINIDRLFLMGLFAVSIGVLSLDNKSLRKSFKKNIFLVGILFLFIFGLIGLYPYEFQKKLVIEDGLVENLQFLVLVFGSIFSFKVSLSLIAKQKRYGPIFFAFAIVLFMVAGDEISWGQRIVGYKTPQAVVTNNLQGETTIHNVNGFHSIIPVAYTFIGLYGSLAWIIIKNPKLAPFFVPAGYLVPYFLSTAIYNVVALSTGFEIGVWSEMVELMLYSGITLHLLSLPLFATGGKTKN